MGCRWLWTPLSNLHCPPTHCLRSASPAFAMMLGTPVPDATEQQRTSTLHRPALGTQSGFAGNPGADAACTQASSEYEPEPARKRTPTRAPKFPRQPGRLRREQCAGIGRDGTRPTRKRKALCRDAGTSSLSAPVPWARPRGSPPPIPCVSVWLFA